MMRRGVVILVSLLTALPPMFALAQPRPPDTQRADVPPATPADQAAPHPLRTWAVLVSADLRKAGLEDQVLIGLSADKAITLVDRARLDLVANEMSLTGLCEATGSADRVKAGRLLQADGLIVLSRQRAESQPDSISLVLCDVRSGARLLNVSLPLDEKSIESAGRLALDSINRTRQRFPTGVKLVFGVPAFVSRTFTLDYDYLQRGYASLLAESLASQQGVAVIEVDEARHIAREVALGEKSGTDRVTPLVIEGEYRVTKPPAGEPSVAFQVKIIGGSADRQLPDRTTKLSEGADYIRRDLAASALGLTAAAIQNPLTADQQATALFERAAVFARLGSASQAVPLWEAGLLLKDDPIQRSTLIREYDFMFYSCHTWPLGTVLGSDQHLAWVAHDVELWPATLAHVEYLIRNRQVTQPAAVDLAGHVMSNGYNPASLFVRIEKYGVKAQKRPDSLTKACRPLESAKKRFLREVAPLIASLPDGPADSIGHSDWTGLLSLAAENFAYGRDGYVREWDIEFLVEATTRILPADRMPHRSIIRLVAEMFPLAPAVKGDVHPQLKALFNGLVTSDRPACKLLGRAALLRWRLLHRREQPVDLAALMADVELAIADYRNLAPTLKDATGHTRLRDTIESLRDEVIVAQGSKTDWQKRNDADVAAAQEATRRLAAAQAANPSSKPESPVVCEPIPLRLKTLSGQTAKVRFDLPFGAGYWDEHPQLVKGVPGVDVFWFDHTVTVMRQNGLLEEIAVSPQEKGIDHPTGVNDVKWDGRNLWISSSRDGVRVLSLKGEVLAKFGEAEGLPADYAGVRICPIEPGKVLLAGNLRTNVRLWLAIAQYDGQKAQAKVFHEGTRVPVGKEKEIDPWSRDPDTHWVGVPNWTVMLEPPEEGGVRRIVVGWDGTWNSRITARPIEVDLASLKVSVSQEPLGKSDGGFPQIEYSIVQLRGKVLEATGGKVVIGGKEIYMSNGGNLERFDSKSGTFISLGRCPFGSLGWSAINGLVGLGWKGLSKITLRTTTTPAPGSQPATRQP